MVSIVTKRIKGNEYLYLVYSIRKKKKVIQKTIKYIGPKRPIPIQEFDCMKLSYKKNDWILINYEDQLSYKHHSELKSSSKKYEEYLKLLDSVSKIKEKEKFLSEFIASSNAIEGSTMTAKETHDFLFDEVVPKNHTKKELFMAENMLDAWKYLEKNKDRMPTKEDIFIMHKKVNKGIEDEETLGKYKKFQNYIGDVCTTSHLFVEEKMKEFFIWIKKAFKKIDDFEVAFQSHAQFEIIHPFVDGNGRVGRLFLNWLLLLKNHSPLAIRKTQRSEYILALENSRRGKIEATREQSSLGHQKSKEFLSAICKFCFKEYMQQYKFI